jgi:ribosomal protein L11 methyltransferase
MSFGTAHHETTSLMVEQIMALDLKGKRVLDMGCGTGVLAILAAKKGTSNITAIDIDEGAFNNSICNIERNQVGFIKVLLGDAKLINEKFDVIFANINRNILINDIPVYAKHLNKSGLLLLSGFYETDIPIITDKAKSCNINFLAAARNNNWAFLKFQKR